MGLVLSATAGLHELGDTEVKELRHAVGGHQNVGGLEITVNHQVLVRVTDRAADLPEQFKPLLDR